MPGSWERSRLARDRQSASHGPSRASRSGGFFVVRTHGLIEHPGDSRNGRPGSRGSRGKARAQVRGACRRERGDEPDTDGRANPDGSQHAARRQRRDRIFVDRFAAMIAAQPTLVVKMSDTSLHGKAGSNPAFDARTVDAALGEACTRHGAGLSARTAPVLSSLTPISPVPQRTHQWPMRKHRPGGGEDVCYFG